MRASAANRQRMGANKLMKMIPVAAMRKIYLMIPLIFLSVPVLAQSPPAKILYVGAISIEPCQDAKVLADWYSKFGIDTKEFKGGYYAQIGADPNQFFFAIHSKKADAAKKCSPSLSIVFRVDNFEASLAAAKSKGLVPDKIEKDPNEGEFAHFHDPDGNEVTIWGK